MEGSTCSGWGRVLGACPRGRVLRACPGCEGKRFSAQLLPFGFQV